VPCRSKLDPAPRAHKTPGLLKRLPQRGPAQVSRPSAARGWPVVMLVNHRSIAEGYRRVRRRPSARRTRALPVNLAAVAAVPSAVGPAAARRGGLCAFNSTSRRRIPPGGATGRPRGRTRPLSCPGGPRRAGRRHAGGVRVYVDAGEIAIYPDQGGRGGGQQYGGEGAPEGVITELGEALPGLVLQGVPAAALAAAAGAIGCVLPLKNTQSALPLLKAGLSY